MKFSGTIHTFPKSVKRFLIFFLISLSFGYFTGFSVLNKTTEFSADGIEQRYNGNEGNEEEAEEMIFKKSEAEVLMIIHTHVISMSLIFLALGSILITTSVNQKLKAFLLIEPFVSIVVTFGGIWLLWKEILWFKYIVMFSGILLTGSFIAIVLILLWQLILIKPDNKA